MTLTDINYLAYAYMRQSPEQHLLAAYVAILLGGLLGGLLWRGDAVLNRSRYILGLGANAFLMGLAQVAQLFWTELLLAHLAFLAVLTEIAIWVLGGMVLCWLARARARDGFGHARLAWLAFLPPLGMWLLARRGPNPGSLWAALPVYGAAVVLVAMARLITEMIGAQVNIRKDARFDEPAVIAAYSQLDRRSTDVLAELDALVTGTTLPSLVGNGLILTALTRDALHLTYRFTFDAAAPGGDAPATAADLKAYYCDLIGPQMDKGATVTLAFSGDAAPSATAVDLSLATCSP